jgi:formate dehydrogenase iron-sulfur subunit
MCYQKIIEGELDQPACTGACPTGATIFGEREELLEEARRRIHAHPELYMNHIWGEYEVGGTSVLYISDVELDEAGWPRELGNDARPVLARHVLHTVPYTFVGVAAAMYGVHWTFERRKKVAETEGVDQRQPNDATDGEAGEES